MDDRKIKSGYKIFIKKMEEGAITFNDMWLENKGSTILAFRLIEDGPIFLGEYPNRNYSSNYLDQDNRIDNDKKVILKEYLKKTKEESYSDFSLLALDIDVFSKS